MFELKSFCELRQLHNLLKQQQIMQIVTIRRAYQTKCWWCWCWIMQTLNSSSTVWKQELLVIYKTCLWPRFCACVFLLQMMKNRWDQCDAIKYLHCTHSVFPPRQMVEFEGFVYFVTVMSCEVILFHCIWSHVFAFTITDFFIMGKKMTDTHHSLYPHCFLYSL